MCDGLPFRHVFWEMPFGQSLAHMETPGLPGRMRFSPDLRMQTTEVFLLSSTGLRAAVVIFRTGHVLSRQVLCSGGAG